MNKSVIFLINGLGIEKPNSYSISINQCMPKLSYIRETSFYNTAVINSLDSRTAYEHFFLGDTLYDELNFINNNVINNLEGNVVYKDFSNRLRNQNSKLHIFLEPSNNKIVDSINSFIVNMGLDNNQKIYLHLLVSQQSVNEYEKLINIINYIQYNIDTRIQVGFIIGHETYNTLNKENNDFLRKMLFYCNVERWSEVDKKLLSYKDKDIRPCLIDGFCSTNSCNIENNDVIFFFNTKRDNYDIFIDAIINNSRDVFKNQNVNLLFYSLIKLDSKYQVPFLCENIKYNNSLISTLQRINKKVLIVTLEKNISLINFIVNGFNNINNSFVSFMKIDDYNYIINNLNNIIDNSGYDLIIFDYHMDVSKTINDLKEQLEKIDQVLGIIGDICMNKYSLFITSLYGIKKTLPLASYNNDMVTIDYEMQIPIFFFDYRYPRSKYTLFPGYTNDILQSALKCISDDNTLYSLIKRKGFINNILGVFKNK